MKMLVAFSAEEPHASPRFLVPQEGKKELRVNPGTTSRDSAVSPRFQRALEFHQNGRLDEAEELYAQILHAEPKHAGALHYLGLLAHQRGRTEDAMRLMERAIDNDPAQPAYFLNFGQFLETNGELDNAIINYRQAALLDPGSELAHHRLGSALHQQGNLDEAALAYSRELGINPNSFETINSLGTILAKTGRREQSLVLYQKAISLQPDYAEAHNNLGLSLNALGRLPEAIESWKRAIQLKPSLAAAYSNLGAALIAQGDSQGAIESLQRAIALEPDLVEAHLNLGNAYRAHGFLSKAVQSFQKAIALAPGNGGPYNNLAETYKDQGKLELAVETFQKALTADPGFTVAYSNLLHFHAFTRYISPQAEKTLARGWEMKALSEEERAAARKRAPANSGVFPLRPREGRRLRLGIVSAELGGHAVAQFLAPVLEKLDRSRFHLTLFPTSRRSCSRAQHFRDLADNYILLTQFTDAHAADRIRSEQIDVLMDTTGHTAGCRLGIFAHRAAPVQCTYLGYWGTTGLTEMDWVLGDPYVLPSMQAHFTERIWWMSRFAVCYQGEDSLPESKWSPDPGGTIWLGSLNRLNKIRERTACLWSRVLHALPEAKLLLEDAAPHEDETHRRILALLSAHGIDECRVEFVPFVFGHERHMALYDRIDVALDTLPFNSATTAFDALWMGVPFVALEGTWAGDRIGSSALKAFGRPEWVAKDDDDYASIVCSLARDVTGRLKERKSQRARMARGPLCYASAMSRALEEAFEGMYECWMRGIASQESLRVARGESGGAPDSSSAPARSRLRPSQR